MIEMTDGDAKEIRKVPDPILRQTASEWNDPYDWKLWMLELDMAISMRKAGGYGICAPQIGVSRRVILINRELVGGPGDLLMVNPKIGTSSVETEVEEEGCLSIPGASIRVRRPKQVLVHYRNSMGTSGSVQADGLFGRCIQHEIDHLDGILITDKAGERPPHAEVQ